MAIFAIDNAGAMYGVMDLAERIHMKGSLAATSRLGIVNPRFPFRAIKFDLNWFSYRKFPALTLNTETCKDLKMWESFLA
ncbi:MAG: hypothetical protein GF398_02235 [Chitinivibrionales bacterium]|nr:hypothetical protein [Chitinivibrionales bacterium]